MGSDNPNSLKLDVFVVCSDKVMLQFWVDDRPNTYEAYQSRLTNKKVYKPDKKLTATLIGLCRECALYGELQIKRDL
jgi:hypothetical protein